MVCSVQSIESKTVERTQNNYVTFHFKGYHASIHLPVGVSTDSILSPLSYKVLSYPCLKLHRESLKDVGCSSEYTELSQLNLQLLFRLTELILSADSFPVWSHLQCSHKDVLGHSRQMFSVTKL